MHNFPYQKTLNFKNSLYEFTEYHLVGKEAVLVAPVLGIIRDRLGLAGLRFEEVLSVPNGDQIF